MSRIVIFGLTVSSSWGNGHATLWRAFTLHARANGDGLFAYGSVIDNASGDPVFVGGR